MIDKYHNGEIPTYHDHVLFLLPHSIGPLVNMGRKSMPMTSLRTYDGSLLWSGIVLGGLCMQNYSQPTYIMSWAVRGTKNSMTKQELQGQLDLHRISS